MEHSPSRQQNHNEQKPGHTSSRHLDMAMVAASPHSHTAFQNEYRWDAPRLSSQPPRPAPEPASVSLPSIRLAFPELRLPSKPQEALGNPQSAHTSPSSATTGHLTSPGYVHTPGTTKRRRDSLEDDQERERARQVPRLYRSSEAVASQVRSPVQPASVDSWAPPSRSSPFPSRAKIPAPMEIQESVEPRPTLPSLPASMSLERGVSAKPPSRDYNSDGGYVERRPPIHHQAPGPWETAPPPPVPAPARYGPGSFDYPPPRAAGHAPSMSMHYEQRTPFSNGPYSRPYSEYSHYSDLPNVGIVSDGKQRKRRGNLPKETTDKLRSWFLAHLAHPYPTEDEKQELMRQTGLQMNQISNWFINARRRQLPTMINNARVESDAMNSRAGDGSILPTTERGDGGSGHADSSTLSDGEGAGYEEDMETLRRRGPQSGQRGSV